MLQQAPLDIFDSLKAGDFLFYDGSHCAKAASDVNWFFFRLLPRLQPGVIIHLHDIHFPEDYADDVIFTRGQTWNEQYVLQAFLMHNAAYRILLANRYLFHRRKGALEQMCQGVQPAVGCSFWMEKILPVGQKGNFHNGQPATATAANGSAAERALTPPASDNLQTLERLLGDYAARTQSWSALGAEHLLQQFTTGHSPEPISIQRQPPVAPKGPDGFPIPPVDLTMGYGAGDRSHYLATGRRSYEILSGLLAAQGISLERGDWMLDWGCAAGRAVRNFVAEASRGCHVWGCAVHAPSIAWPGTYLSLPFKFFNTSPLPHLPFPENRFKFIYGLSVFTHLLVMRDLWLLELHRVLSHDGCLILTIHDEHTWGWFRQRGMPAWMPSELRQLPELPGECVEVRGNSWEYCYTFFHSDYVRRAWGQYFKVAEIIPCADSYQAAVIFRIS